MYLDWELEKDVILARHFYEHNQVRAAVSTFSVYASTWLDDFCDLYPNVVVVNRKMPWDDLSWGRMCARGFGGGFW
jgi:hypothetical protein